MTFKEFITPLGLDSLLQILLRHSRAAGRADRRDLAPGWRYVINIPKKLKVGEHPLQRSHRRAGGNQQWGVIQRANRISWFPRSTSSSFSHVPQLPDSYGKKYEIVHDQFLSRVLSLLNHNDIGVGRDPRLYLEKLLPFTDEELWHRRVIMRHLQTGNSGIKLSCSLS